MNGEHLEGFASALALWAIVAALTRSGASDSDDAPVIRWCRCGAAVAGVTVREARRFAREHCDGAPPPAGSLPSTTPEETS